MNRIDRWLLSVMFFSVAFMHAMEKKQSVSLEIDPASATLPVKKKKVRSLKKICCDVLIQKTPEIAKSVFEQNGLEGLKYALACEVACVGSHNFILSTMNSVPVNAMPHMVLNLVRGKNKNMTQEESHESLEALNTCSKQDFYSHQIVEELKRIYDAYNSSDTPPSKLDLFCFSLGFNRNSCVLNKFLFKKSYSKKYFIEQTINIPHDEKYFLHLVNKYKNEVLSENYFHKLAIFANEAGATIETESDKQKVAGILAVGLMYRHLLTQLHKLLYLGFMPSPGYSFTSRVFNGIDAANEIFHYKEHTTCIDYAIHNVKKCFNKKCRSLNYARFKLSWGGNGYRAENLEHMERVMSFYRNFTKDTDYYDYHDRHEKNTPNFALATVLFNYEKSFYINILKLLLPSCKEEFASKKTQCAKAIGVPTERLEEYICKNSFYDVAIQKQWTDHENRKGAAADTSNNFLMN